MARDVQNLYKKLEHVDHILLRPDRHVGSTRDKTVDTWVVYPSKIEEMLKWETVTFHPALLKLFDEIITNSVDFSKTPEGSHLNSISVTVNQFMGSITVEDNGGIPIELHKEYGGWIPDMLFGELYSGSNYNEHDEELANADGAGQNGEGASLVNVFSTNFTVRTCDGKSKFSRTWLNNMSKDSKPAEVVPFKGTPGTAITYIPDYKRFNLQRLDTGNFKMLVRRAYEIAACNPHINVTINGQPIRMNHFRDFSMLFGCSAVEETTDWKVGIYQSDDPVHHSYVNSVHTAVGGPHVEYVLDKIIEYTRPKLKRAYKVDYKPGVIRSVIGLVLVCNIKTPRFDSQTKEHMTTKVSEFGTKWEPTERFLDKCAKSIIEWMGNYHDSLVAKEEASAVEEAEKKVEKVQYHNIPKYEPATSSNRSGCVLYLTEGDSAAKPILAARDTKTHGVFPLRGKFLNVTGASKKDISSCAELTHLLAIMRGLKLNGDIDFQKLRYHKIVISTDADVDGAHIRGLVCKLFMRFWPEFIKQGRLCFLETPVVVGKKGKDRHEFFEERDFEEYVKSTGVRFDRVKYIKGLGGDDTSVFRNYLMDSKYQRSFEYDEDAESYMDLAFNKKRADDRKPLFEMLSMVDIGEE